MSQTQQPISNEFISNEPINKEPITKTITNNENPTQEIRPVEATQQQPVQNADDGSLVSYMKRSFYPSEYWPFRSDAPLKTVVAPVNQVVQQAAQPVKSNFSEFYDRFNNAVFRGGKKTKGKGNAKGKKPKKKSKRRSTKKSKKAAKAPNKA
jgi:hypothetical protein